MPLLRTDGIVLRTRELGERDRLVTLYTRDLGRLTAVYLALGRNRARVQRVLLLGDETFSMTGDPELLVGYLDAARDVELVGALGREGLEQGRIFVVDPLGNLVMSYPPAPDQAQLLRDLERLLEVSRIG